MSHWRAFVDAQARGGRYLPWKEVARTTGLSRTTAWRLQKRDDFPAPYAISPGRVGYREDEVEAWRVSRDHSAARGKPPGPPREGASCGTPAAAAAPVPSPRSAAPADGPRQTVSATPAAHPVRKRRRTQHAQAIAQQMLFDF